MVDSTPLKTAVRVVESLEQVKRDEWQVLAGSNPFVSYDFLRLLETSGCASSKAGWSPRYLLVEEGGRLAGAVAAYLKSHSRGEFVFDQSWAQAFERHGLEYYPKLVVSVPFTPVEGPRLLANSEATRRRLAQELIRLAQKESASSVHALFLEEADRAALAASGFMTRESVQFHWQNNAFKSLDGFLGTLTHDKRKKIRQDSRYVAEAGITFRWLTHEDIQVTDLQFFYACYVHTYREHWSTPYLSFDFFVELHRTRAAPLVLVLAVCDDAPVACALNVLGDKTLYGRYWGTTKFVRGLHFETCYLQAIAFCIENQVEVFEGGAQGEHKMARGLMPVKTYSAHWISNRRFATAIEDFLVRETEAVDEYVDNLVDSAPFRQVQS